MHTTDPHTTHSGVHRVGPTPGAQLDIDKMPGHWLLARLGKRVLRPGGLELTRHMLDELAIGASDRVVEFAPGLGVTTRLTLQREPHVYTGIERDADAAQHVQGWLRPGDNCVVGTASKTGLDASTATVVYGEAMLTMQTAAQKKRIVEEAARVLQPGGRYGIHELGLTPDGLDEDHKARIGQDLSAAIRVGARPQTATEWRALLEAGGFEVLAERAAPMHLLEPARMVRDEGVRGAARVAFNVLRSAAARRRVRGMRAAFKKHRQHINAVMLVARKR